MGVAVLAGVFVANGGYADPQAFTRRRQRRAADRRRRACRRRAGRPARAAQGEGPARRGRTGRGRARRACVIGRHPVDHIAMPPVSRGFHGRRRDAPTPTGSRPGSTSSTTSRCSRPARPRTRRSTSGASPSTARSTSRGSWTWEEFRALPTETFTVDIHCVTKWTQARHDLDGRVGRHAARGRRHRGGVPDRVVRRRLHDQPRRSRTSATARRGSCYEFDGEPLEPEHGGPARLLVPAPVLLEERQVGARADPHATTTSPASGRRPATTTTATRGGSSGTGATERRPRPSSGGTATVREIGRGDRPRAHARPRRARLAGPPRRPARRRAPDRRGRLPGAALVLDRLGAGARRGSS